MFVVYVLWFVVCVRCLWVWFGSCSCSLLASAGLVTWCICVLAVMSCVICVGLLCDCLLVLLFLDCGRVLFTS